MKYQATTQRSITKSFTFRAAVIVSDLVVIYIITRHIATTIWLTVFTNLASTILYFFHERIWNNVGWGRLSAKGR